MTDYLKNIKDKIGAGNLKGAEQDLHYLIVNRDFDKVWGAGTLPVLWGFVSNISLDDQVPTAAVDLRNGSVSVNPTFLVEKIDTLSDLLFILMHELDHRLIRRLFQVNWSRLRKILDYNEDWILKIRNVLEDAWINASVRGEMGIDSDLPERFYCWTAEDAAKPGMPSLENMEGTGFDPKIHKIGDPRSEEYALLTCMSHRVAEDISDSHYDLYKTANKLQKKNKVPNARNSRYGGMLSFPEWYDAFCDWLEEHKDDLKLPTPGCNGDKDCPVHGESQEKDQEKSESKDSGEQDAQGSGSDEGDEQGNGDEQGSDGEGGEKESQQGTGGKGQKPGKGKGSNKEQNGQDDQGDANSEHQHGGQQECTCRDGEGLLSEPMSLAERLSRIPVIIVDRKDIEEILDTQLDLRKGAKPDETPEVYTLGGKGASWGGRIQKHEILPKVVQDLEEVDRELLEMGGSSLTNSFRTATARVKGAVKQIADEMVQNVATLRVTEHKIIRPDFNIPSKVSKRNIMQMGMGQMPVMWDCPQYLEQHELVVYTDVSGSMNEWYPVALYISNQLKEFGCEMYQFSTCIVKPEPGKDDNIFWTDGGTDFDVVAKHIVEHKFKAVVVITDNCDALNEPWLDAMRELPELYAIFLTDGNRPRNYDPKTHAFGGDWGRAGWQRVTDKVTGIFSSDIPGGINRE